MIRISVVVPTFHRPALLRRCLDALLAQRIDSGAFEILIVDDGHDEAARDLVLEIEGRRGVPAIHYLRPLRGHGPSVARNCGWQAARGALIAFTDDDTIPAPGWLAAGEAALAAQPHWVAAGGRVEVPLASAAQRPPRDHERMTQGLEAAEFVTANAFVRRAALERVGGFDERFKRAWREDSDLHFRLLREAGPVGRAEDARVIHPVRAEPWGVCLRQQRNTFFDALLYKKHPRLYRERIRRVPPWDYYLIVVLVLVAPLLWLLHAGAAAALAILAALALIAHVAWRRLRRADRSPEHVGEMLATSALIPFLSVYWRVRGAIHFRVLFV